MRLLKIIGRLLPRPVSGARQFFCATIAIGCCILFVAGGSIAQSLSGPEGIVDPSQPLERNLSLSFGFAKLDVPIAGVAADEGVVFVGEPLSGSVVVLSRLTGKQIAELPPPPNGFAVPFVMHIVGPNRVAILDAGGLPQPSPFIPAEPSIYEYAYGFGPGGFSAKLVRTISFASVLIGFPEDFVRLADGRYLMSDSILGSIWIAQPDDTITPGIVPRSFAPADLIPRLAFCPTMPEVIVNGYPFLFTGSTLPGVSPLAVRHGTVYYYSPCARGIYSFPLSVLSNNEEPYQRASAISLVAQTPADIPVEELLDFSFNPYDEADPFLYAAQPLQLQVIRIDVTNGGAREVLASGGQLFDFPSSLTFVPPGLLGTDLLVVSNQQERSPLTNDAVSQTSFNLPFVVAQIIVRHKVRSWAP